MPRKFIVLLLALVAGTFLTGCAAGGQADSKTIEQEDKQREQHNEKAGLSNDNM